MLRSEPPVPPDGAADDRVPARPGRPRELVHETTNIGPVMDEAVTRTRQRMAPAGLDDDYDLAHEHFDLTHFLLQAPQFLTRERDPLENFLSNGAEARASPEINFDMRAYLARHPERADGSERSPYVAWLRHGRAAGEIADPAPGLDELAHVLALPVADVVAQLGGLRLDLQERLRHGRLGEMLARAADVEPLVGGAWSETTHPRIPPFDGAEAAGLAHAVFRAQEQAGFRRARVVLVVSDPRWGGGRRAEGHIAHALAEHMAPDEVVIVYTDRSGSTPPDRFPAGVREVDLAGLVADLTPEVSDRALAELVRSFHAEVVVNVNSQLMYRAIQWYGPALASSERVFLLMFCNEQTALGTWVGLPMRQFYRCFPYVAGVVTDSHHLAGWLAERHQLPARDQERIHVLSAPVDPRIPLVPRNPRPAGGRPQVFWAGRFDRQKRLDIAYEVAHRMPDVEFRMWGERVLLAPGVGAPPDNVRLHGPYRHISELDLGDADAWLYTSGWDGVPSLLLEVAMAGVPIVGSLVGGTGEVLRDGSWPIADHEDPDAYVAALREVVADPDAARVRAASLRRRLTEERTAAAYAQRVKDVLLGGGPQPEAGTVAR